MEIGANERDAAKRSTQSGTGRSLGSHWAVTGQSLKVTTGNAVTDTVTTGNNGQHRHSRSDHIRHRHSSSDHGRHRASQSRPVTTDRATQPLAATHSVDTGPTGDTATGGDTGPTSGDAAQQWRAFFGPWAWLQKPASVRARIENSAADTPVAGLWVQKEMAKSTYRFRQRHPDLDPSLLPYRLPAPHQSAWAARSNVPETDEYLRKQPSPEAYSVPTTQHVSVMWYETAQLQRVAAAGIDPHCVTAEGPNPTPPNSVRPASIHIVKKT
eukprot:SAG31_NODE_5025_length_2798_cov_2.083364_1_plen_269_part_00